MRFSEKNINYISELFRSDGSIKTWHKLKLEHRLHENSYSQWLQAATNECYSRRMEIYNEKNHENTTNLV